MPICQTCKREYEYERKKGHTQDFCNSCWTNKRRWKIKARAVEYLGGKCIRCGFNKSIGALAFHHKDPSIKEFGIGAAYNRTWDSIKKELDKCDLLCMNCHAMEHFKGS